MSVSDIARRFLGWRKHAYTVTFRNPMGEAVLGDLARFCRAHSTTFTEDPRAHAVLEGRREVWLRIQQHLRLTDDDLWRLYGQPKPPVNL